ncbi:hypothetical protein Anacy_1364 [Anabaena cylindrica PCC 7122]|uniref:Uncharacterized protein n=1 Tax=Anabaena cylindrica (strain ATCC 27899 / PCC 7122) TaxID=272123 RepID=K9ZE59_ANACC|nr:hypothetical protein Anacy_1364 [Anabaena cylindrica PCC 7122]BAY06165.1 hypothetical protein NIES19_54480 [Anabaena cylindrica PCC 7122]
MCNFLQDGLETPAISAFQPYNTVTICVKCLVDYGYGCARAKINALFQVKSELQVIKCLMIQTLKKSSNVSDNLKGNIPVKSSTALAHLHQIPNNGVNY